MLVVNMQVGQVVADRFKLVQRLGQGGFSEVWLTADLGAERAEPVALKVLREEQRRQPPILERFRQEAILLAELRHPGIARAFELIERDEIVCYSMEYIGGRTLKTDLERRARERRAYSTDDVRAIVGGMAAALDFAHGRGVAHRDLKPANVMLVVAEKNAGHRVKLVDFGIAKDLAAGPADQTTAGRMLGSLAYMTPEQTRCGPVSAQTDVFALATIAFEVLTLCRAWLIDERAAPLSFGRPATLADANAPAGVFDRINRAPRPSVAGHAPNAGAVDAVLAQALAVAPENRHRTASEFADAMLAALEGGAPAVRLAAPAAPGPVDTIERVGAQTIRDTSLDAMFDGHTPVGVGPALGEIAVPIDLLATDEQPAAPDPASMDGWPSAEILAAQPSPKAGAEPLIVAARRRQTLELPDLSLPVIPQPLSRSDIALTGYSMPESAPEVRVARPPTQLGLSVEPRSAGLGVGLTVLGRSATDLRSVGDWDSELRKQEWRRWLIAGGIIAGVGELIGRVHSTYGPQLAVPLLLVLGACVAIVVAMSGIGSRRTRALLAELSRPSPTTELRFEIAAQDHNVGYVLRPVPVGDVSGVLAETRRARVRLRTHPSWRHAFGRYHARIVVELPPQAAAMLGRGGVWRAFAVDRVVAETLRLVGADAASRRVATDAEFFLRQWGAGTLETNGHELVAHVRLDVSGARMTADGLGGAVRAMLVTARTLWTGRPPLA